MRRVNINKSFNPRLRSLGHRSPYLIYLVDDEQIRNQSLPLQEFGGFATHLNFPAFIPREEIWIGKSVPRPEIDLYVINAITQLKAASSLNDFSLIYDAGLTEERIQRASHVDDVLYQRHFGEMRNAHQPLDVWLINGKYVRDHFKIDFVEGGHGIVYDFVPLDEIWIESTLTETEIPVIILHEYVEYHLMSKGLNYHQAHSIAARIEFSNRRRFDRLDALNLSPQDIDMMTIHHIQPSSAACLSA